MREDVYGDYPKVPSKLDKTKPLETDIKKSSGLLPRTKHLIKQLLIKFKDAYNDI